MEKKHFLKNKTFFVIGSKGLIGNDLSKRLIEVGCKVISCDVKNKENIINNEIFFKSDITTKNGLKSIEQFIKNFDKKIDGFINCAYPRPESWGKSFEDISIDEINLHLNVQLGPTIILSRIFCEYLKKNGGGALVNISSIQGISAPKFNHYEGTNMTSPIEYSCVKSSIIIMTKWLAKYYKNANLNINCVSPGGIQDEQSKVFQENYKIDCNNIGLLQPRNVTDAILFLLSDESKAISGQNLIIDDGWSL